MSRLADQCLVDELGWGNTNVDRALVVGCYFVDADDIVSDDSQTSWSWGFSCELTGILELKEWKKFCFYWLEKRQRSEVKNALLMRSKDDISSDMGLVDIEGSERMRERHGCGRS